MALPSEWTAWVQTSTWIEGVYLASEWTNWSETTTWIEESRDPSEWTAWVQTTTWTGDGPTIGPSPWSVWVEAQLSKPSTWFYVNQQGGLSPLRLYAAGRVPVPVPEPQALVLGSAAGTGTSFAQWNSECINDGSKPGAANNGMAVHRTYSAGGIVSNFMSTAAAGDVANGVASMWSCKPDLSQVSSASLDATFISFFNSIPAGHRVWAMMWHEPWDDQFNWVTYRAAQARVWDLLHNASTADTNLVKWGILGTGFDFQQGRAQANFFPAGGEYDWVGVDIYDFYRNLNVMPTSPRGRNNHRTPQQMYGDTVDFAASVGKPTVVGEFGLHPDPENPNGPTNWQGIPSWPHRFAAIIDYFVANNVEAAAYFHSPHGDDGPWWAGYWHNFSSPQDRTSPDQYSMAAFRDALALYGKQ